MITDESIQTEIFVEVDDRITLVHRLVKDSKAVLIHSMNVDVAGKLVEQLQFGLAVIYERHHAQLKERGLDKTFDLKTGRSLA